jgi:hypothetical protein
MEASQSSHDAVEDVAAAARSWRRPYSNWFDTLGMEVWCKIRNRSKFVIFYVFYSSKHRKSITKRNSENCWVLKYIHIFEIAFCDRFSVFGAVKNIKNNKFRSISDFTPNFHSQCVKSVGIRASPWPGSGGNIFDCIMWTLRCLHLFFRNKKNVFKLINNVLLWNCFFQNALKFRNVKWLILNG